MTYDLLLLKRKWIYCLEIRSSGDHYLYHIFLKATFPHFKYIGFT